MRQLKAISEPFHPNFGQTLCAQQAQFKMQLGEIDIVNIRLEPRSRDDIPQLLRRLQYLHTDKTLRATILEVLARLAPKTINSEMGRPGMALLKIFLMGSLRLNLNCDYDWLQLLA